MKTVFVVTLAATLCLPLAHAQQSATGTLGAIERLDPALDKLILPGAVIEKIAEGFDWSEGPVWMPAEGCLLFSDVPRNTVYRWTTRVGVSVFLKSSGYTGQLKSGQQEPGSNGLTLDAEGRLVLCEHGDRRVARLERNGRKTTLADRYEGKRLNSPNDLVFKSNGDLYFTDPPYGLPKLNNDPTKELPFNGVYRLARNGGLTLLIHELIFPNGLAFSPDEKTLYVANSDSQRAIWMAYDVKPDGTLANGRVFFDATPLRKGRKGLPDGMKVDGRGNIFATGPGGVLIFSPDGKHLGTIKTGEATGNCAWGDDGSILYITANMFLCRVKTITKGTGF
ncbi:MAG: SMP-30/gluconolactonase/LRE family protein [Verrucomicrobia bacterium]|nr:SMP-30/gluconolactonase/LRE family protein [Verrucomicrobiota bacterium]